MTHYKQCCARECEWCAGGHPVYGLDSDRYHVNPGAGVVHESDKFACTAPTLAEFAERCAGALEQIRRVFNGAGDTEASETMPDKMYVIASRALGLEK